MAKANNIVMGYVYGHTLVSQKTGRKIPFDDISTGGGVGPGGDVHVDDIVDATPLGKTVLKTDTAADLKTILNIKDGERGPAGPAGSNGATGPQGPQGATGLQGPQGERGEKGNTGSQGSEGPQGPAGAVGPAGLEWKGVYDPSIAYVKNDAVAYNGATYFAIQDSTNIPPDPELRVNAHWALMAAQGGVGPQGPRGNQGAEGPQGPAGDDGPVGPQGLQGNPGAQGVKGDKGDDGVPGVKGDTGSVGAVGPTGPMGPMGPQGATGTQGERGPAGIPGTDGADGTQGPQGPQGPRGDAGVNGADGAPGSDGPQGQRGEKGEIGVQGPVGPQGPQGPEGQRGERGLPGATGLEWRGSYDPATTYNANDSVSHNGSTYFCILDGTVGIEPGNGASNANWAVLSAAGEEGPRGERGEQGPVGPQGPRGDVGPQGGQGIQGERGPVGPTGPEGQKGATGSTGAQGPMGPSFTVNGKSPSGGNINVGTVTSVNGIAPVPSTGDVNLGPSLHIVHKNGNSTYLLTEADDGAYLVFAYEGDMVVTCPSTFKYPEDKPFTCFIVNTLGRIDLDVKTPFVGYAPHVDQNVTCALLRGMINWYGIGTNNKLELG